MPRLRLKGELTICSTYSTRYFKIFTSCATVIDCMKNRHFGLRLRRSSVPHTVTPFKGGPEVEKNQSKPDNHCFRSSEVPDSIMVYTSPWHLIYTKMQKLLQSKPISEFGTVKYTKYVGDKKKKKHCYLLCASIIRMCKKKKKRLNSEHDV